MGKMSPKSVQKSEYPKLVPIPSAAPSAAFLRAQNDLRIRREQTGKSAYEIPRDDDTAYTGAEARLGAVPHVAVTASVTGKPDTAPAGPPLPAATEPVPASDVLPRFVFVVMILVGCGCAVMSAINTATFLVNSGRPLPLAFATAVLTTLFSGTAFFIGSLCIKKKIYGGFIFYALAAAIIGYSVFSSISVTYVNMRAAEASSVEALEFASQTEALLAVNAKEQLVVTENITQYTQEKERLLKEADYWTDKSWAKHDGILASIASNDERIDTQNTRKYELLEEERVLKSRGTESAAASTKTVYAFMSGGNPQKERVFRYAALVIPAVFFDLASPLMLGIALLFFQRRTNSVHLRPIPS
ncbi:MAG: hypothetical protein LBB61_07860 [Treponema sp.]|nr:hypothetical protein [Treponema sp.]